MELLNPLTRTNICPRHGDYLSTGRPLPVVEGFKPIVSWSECKPCVEQRRREAEERVRAEAQLKAEREAAEARSELRKRIIDSGIPRLFLTKRLTDYLAVNPGQKKALGAAKDYTTGFADAHETGRNLLFLGKPGCGKTHLACAIGLEVLDMGGIVRYTTVGDMTRRFTDTWRNRAGESESEVLADFASAALLILDEAGAQSGSDVELRMIFDVIDGRYREQLPTIIVSNLGVDRLTPFMGDRVIDRLRDNGSSLVAFDWASYRGNREVRQ